MAGLLGWWDATIPGGDPDQDGCLQLSAQQQQAPALRSSPLHLVLLLHWCSAAAAAATRDFCFSQPLRTRIFLFSVCPAAARRRLHLHRSHDWLSSRQLPRLWGYPCG